MKSRRAKKHLRSWTEEVVTVYWCEIDGTKNRGELSECRRLGHKLIKRQLKKVKLK